MDTMGLDGGGRPGRALAELFAQPLVVRDLLAAWRGARWASWLAIEGQASRGGLEGRDRRGRPIARGRKAAFWRVCWQGGGDALWLHVVPREGPDPALAPRLGRLAFQLWERLAEDHGREAKGGSGPRTPRLPLVVPLIPYVGALPWCGPRTALDLFWPLPPGLQDFAPRLPLLVFDLVRDEMAPGAGAANLMTHLRALHAAASRPQVEAALARLIQRLDEIGDEGLRHAFSRYLGEAFLPARFPRLFPAAEQAAVWHPSRA
jgi:hypothetical protein